MIRMSTSTDDRDEWDSASATPRPPLALLPVSKDEAARAFQGLPTLQPPPVARDNGGHYLHSPCSPVKTVPGPLDPVLVAGLENARDRMTLLKFEDQIVRFLKNAKELDLHFPPLSSYHRLIVHRLAQRCGLEHQTADGRPLENGSARVVTLVKTRQSVVPRILLIDLSPDRQTPLVTPAAAPKIMMRRHKNLRPGAKGGRGPGLDKATPSLQDRERAYAEARARIFGSSAIESGSSPSPSLTAASVEEDSDSVVGRETNGPRLGTQHATGAEGSTGFEQGRGGTFSYRNSGSQTQDPRPPKECLSTDEPNEFSRASRLSAPNAACWKESKVLWRNREQELNDPDFTRNHDAFRLRSSGGSGSGSGGESPYHGNRFGSGMRFGHGDFHDRSYNQPYGFRHQQTGGAPPPQPPPLPMPMVSPGRGRHHVGEPDYNNRVDNNVFQSPHQQYHVQQQFQQHQLIPPPSMIMERGGYGYPSPQGRPFARQGNWIPPHASTRAVGSSGFIEDDFPPLGK